MSSFSIEDHGIKGTDQCATRKEGDARNKPENETTAVNEPLPYRVAKILSIRQPYVGRFKVIVVFGKLRFYLFSYSIRKIYVYMNDIYQVLRKRHDCVISVR